MRFLTSLISLLSLTSVANAVDFYSPIITLRDQQTSGFPSGGYYVTPIHYNFLPSSGKVLVTGWGRIDPQQCSATGSRKFGVSFTLDPIHIDGATNGGNFNVFPISDAPRTSGEVLYCSGHSPLEGGRILYVGGSVYTNLGQPTQTEIGLDYARIYNPSTNSYTRIPTSMGIGTAWYPTAARFSDGRILISGGFYKCCSGDSEANNQLVTFDPVKYNNNPNDASVWQLLVPQSGSASSRADFLPGLRDYTRIFVLHQSITINNIIYDVAIMGKQGRILLFSSNPTTPSHQKWYVKPNSQRQVPGSSDCGADTTSTIAWTGELVIAFGCNPNGFPTSRIDLYNPITDTWRSIDASARKNAASVLLPNGDILFMNGENPQINQDAPSMGDPRYPVVLRITESSLSLSWGSNDDEFRGYHNVATLLKDGRVLTGGGIWKSGDIGCEQPTARIYTPKYLNDFGPRPQWINPPTQPWILTLSGSGTITFQYSGVTALHDVHPVVLTSVGSTTHSYDPNARMIRFTVTSRASGSITIRIPSDSQYVIPGEYLLWLVSSTGVPSAGLHARVERGTSSTPPPATPPPANNGDPSQWKRAVIYIRKQTVSGQDIFVRGGHDGNLVNQGKYSSMNVPIIFVNTKTNGQAKQNTPYLNWFSSAPLAWTAPMGSAGQPLYSDVGYGQDPENTCCQHNWKLDVLVRGNVGDWFEFKAFMTQSGQADQWESNIQQSGTPYQTINHWARIGFITSVTFGQNQVIQTPIANPSVTSLPYAWNGATTSSVETPTWVSDPVNYTGVIYDQPIDTANSATMTSAVITLMFSPLFVGILAF